MSTQLKKVDENKFEVILDRIVKLEETGVQFPKDYSPENAARAAWLILQEAKDRNSKPVLEVCTTESIANSMLKMVTLGLNPIKKQCYFIPYGDKLECQPSYQGAIATAKRYGLKFIPANVIYKNDAFEYAISEDGRTKVTKHDQSLDNLNGPIIGAYAVANMEDGVIDTTIMTIEDIRKAWEQGATKGKSPAHNNFTGEMCKKTVINRACKTIINSSDDADLFEDRPSDSPVEAHVKKEISHNANKRPLDFEESTEDRSRTIDVHAEQVVDEEIPEMEEATPNTPGF